MIISYSYGKVVYHDERGFDSNGSVDQGNDEDLFSSLSPPGRGWQAQGVPPYSHICIWHTLACKGPCNKSSLRFLNFALKLTNTWQLPQGLARTSAFQRSSPGGIPRPRSCSVLRWDGLSCPDDTPARPELRTPNTDT